MSQEWQERFCEKQALPSYQILYFHPNMSHPTSQPSSTFFCFQVFRRLAVDTYNTTKVNFVPWAMGWGWLNYHLQYGRTVRLEIGHKKV